jgi:hypothetical protein
MKNDIFTKALLAVIAAALVVLAGQSFRGQPTTVHAAVSSPRQTWEYKRIDRTFTYKKGQYDKIDSWEEDGTALPVSQLGSMQLKLSQLGSQGWELVQVVTYSSAFYHTDVYSRLGDTTDGSYNGVTSDETWVFKRLKQ